jgi:hypothetical protein
MSIWTTILEAASLGVRAKAEKDASARAQRNANKNHDKCTPCAAAAKVKGYQEAARARMPSRGR